jgi:hypothetical protein
MMMMGMTADAKIAVNPIMLYQAAMALRLSATSKVITLRNIHLFIVSFG